MRPQVNSCNEMSDCFRGVMERFAASPAIRMLRDGQIRLPHYKAVLREIYHYAKEDPQIQVLAAVYFRGDDRAMVKMFFKHATAEVGHDLLALQDLESLGEDVSLVSRTNPLPSTLALTAFPFYQITYRNPIGFLGYLYFLEFMPTHFGGAIRESLAAVGIPETAMNFLEEHITVDVAHNRLMDEYLTRLIRDDADLSSAIYAMRVTAELYSNMLWGAIESVSDNRCYGRSAEENARNVA